MPSYRGWRRTNSVKSDLARYALLGVTAIAVAACTTGAPEPPAPTTEASQASITPAPPPTVTAIPTPNDAEIVSFSYFQALGIQRYDLARNYLTAELASQLTEAVLAERMGGTDAVGLVAIIPQAISPNRVFYHAIISARSVPEAPGEWVFGANTRYLDVTLEPSGWRIARISNESLAPS